MRPGILKILKILHKKEELTFTELKEETGLSRPSLSEYLKELRECGYITKDAETRKYRIPLAFTPLKHLEGDLQQTMRFITSSALLLAERIGKEKESPEKRRTLEKFWRFYYHAANRLIWRMILQISEEVINEKPIKIEVGNKRVKQAFIEWIIPLFDVLYAVDILLWGDHHVVEEVFNEEGEVTKFNDLFSEFLSVGRKLFEDESRSRVHKERPEN